MFEGAILCTFLSYKYYLVFIDDYSLKYKSGTYSSFVHFKNLVENKFSWSIEVLRSDNWGGGCKEFVNHQIEAYYPRVKWHGWTQASPFAWGCLRLPALFFTQLPCLFSTGFMPYSLLLTLSIAYPHPLLTIYLHRKSISTPNLRLMMKMTGIWL